MKRRAAAVVGLVALEILVLLASAPRRPEEMPLLLSQTGLYADISRRELAAGVLEYEPNFALWTDGAQKRRWIRLPEGTAIDATHLDRWDFPTGTKLWKDFAFDDAVETRMLTRRDDGSWSFASYRWDPDQRDAELVPAEGAVRVAEAAPGVAYDIPSRADCLACHGRSRNVVLGFSAVQLQRPLLRRLQQDGRLTHYAAPTELPGPPTVVDELRGYLHANCGHCHDGEGAMQRAGFRLDLRLADEARVPAFPDAGDVEEILHRLQSNDPLQRMPPLGTHLTDPAAIDLLYRWLSQTGAQPTEAGGDTVR